MKIGLWEIGITLFVVFSIALMFRLFRGDRGKAAQGKKNSLEVRDHQEAVTRSGRVKIAGVAFILLGIIVFLLGMRTFEFVMKMYLWAFILAGAGILALVLSRSR